MYYSLFSFYFTNYTINKKKDKNIKIVKIVQFTNYKIYGIINMFPGLLYNDKFDMIKIDSIQEREETYRW